MANPNYDLLNQVQYFVQDPNSPLMKEVRAELAPLEQRAAGLKEGSPEYKQVNAEYQRKAAAALLTRIQKQFGGAIPNRKETEDADYKQRAAAQGGGDPAQVEAQLRAGSTQAPYQNGFNILEQLQKIAQPPPTPASIVEPGAPTKLGKAAPRSMPKIRDRGAATEDEQLSEGMLHALFGLSQTANESSKTYGQDPRYAQTLDEHDMSGVDKLPYDPKLRTRDDTDADYRNSESDEIPLALPRAPLAPLRELPPQIYGNGYGMPTLANSGPAEDEVPLALPRPLTERPEDEAALRKALAALQEQYK